jgi:tRNA-Thr(GGU) m(6)t(6)A37 methyltransferase TsaA
MTSQKRITLRPIGHVITQAVDDEVKDRTKISQISIDLEYVEGVEGLDGFSHAFVLFWLNQVPQQRKEMKVHPRGRVDFPLVGVFATRTNSRPNPIGLTLVELMEVKGSVLVVRGLDAFDGTPVLDIKPYDSWDMVENAKVPEWRIKLNHERLNHS